MYNNERAFQWIKAHPSELASSISRAVALEIKKGIHPINLIVEVDETVLPILIRYAHEKFDPTLDAASTTIQGVIVIGSSYWRHDPAIEQVLGLPTDVTVVGSSYWPHDLRLFIINQRSGKSSTEGRLIVKKRREYCVIATVAGE